MRGVTEEREVSPALQQAFLALAERLGRTRPAQRRAGPGRDHGVRLEAQWKRLEGEAGRRVTEAEVRSWWVARFQAAMA